MTYVLTGEDASYKGVSPKNNFDPRNGKWGAFEVALRGSEINAGQEVFDEGFANPDNFASEVSEITAGVNWYLNKNVKFQLNYTRTSFDREVEINDATWNDLNSLIFQLQLAF